MVDSGTIMLYPRDSDVHKILLNRLSLCGVLCAVSHLFLEIIEWGEYYYLNSTEEETRT